MSQQTIRIAMWSTWRSLSTALMRAWENRPDTCVWDEPLFPHYLHCLHTGLATGPSYSSDMAILEHYETDWQKIVTALTDAPLPPGKTIQFQKHISLYAHPPMALDWLPQVSNAFLIRRPSAMLASLHRQRPTLSLADTGWLQLEHLFNTVCETTHSIPPVIRAEDLLHNPRRTLSLLCEALAVNFTETMLHWPAGSRPSDAVWGHAWYQSVRNSTEFKAPTTTNHALPAHLQTTAAACENIYERLSVHRLR